MAWGNSAPVWMVYTAGQDNIATALRHSGTFSDFGGCLVLFADRASAADMARDLEARFRASRAWPAQVDAATLADNWKWICACRASGLGFQ